MLPCGNSHGFPYVTNGKRAVLRSNWICQHNDLIASKERSITYLHKKGGSIWCGVART